MKNKLNYPIHTIASAPENSKPGLEQLQKAFGVVPNIAGAIANSPKLINALVGVFAQVHASSLTESEIQIVLLTDAVVNACTYAVAFHTGLALQQGISPEETDAIRENRTPKDKRFAALSTLARTLIEKRGHASEQELVPSSPPGSPRNKCSKSSPLWRPRRSQITPEPSAIRLWTNPSGSTPGKVKNEDTKMPVRRSLGEGGSKSRSAQEPLPKRAAVPATDQMA